MTQQFSGRRLAVAVLLLAAAGLAAADARGPELRGFMEVRGHVVLSAAGEEAFLIIEEVRHVASADSTVPLDTLTVTCPTGATGELRSWRASFTQGDTLRLRWITEQEPSRGFLLWGGRGGKAHVEVPAGGWTASCSCDGATEGRGFPLYGAFVDDRGKPIEPEFEGSGESWPRRLLPLWRGHAPRPGEVRIRCAWNCAELQDQERTGSPSR